MESNQRSLFGYDQGVMGGLLTLPSFVSTFPEIDLVHTGGMSASQINYRSTVQGITVASYNAGCFFGAIVTIWIADILGRRRMIFLGTALIIVGAVLQASALSLGHLIAGRVITGFGNGMNTSTVSVLYPAYAFEFL
jgi:MFS family permease